jgi:hypothetical protein
VKNIERCWRCSKYLLPIWLFNVDHICWTSFSPFTLSTTISSVWPIGCILVRLKCNMHSHLDPHTPNQCLSHPTDYPPILIFPIPMHNCKELSSFSLCVFPLLLRHDLMWDLITHVRSSVGRFSLFCENRPVPIFSWCYENLIGSLIYKFFWAGEKRSCYQIFYFFANSPGSQISQSSYIRQQPVLKLVDSHIYNNILIVKIFINK